MAKKAPSGLGLWIAFEGMITPGKSVKNTIAQAKAMGAKWVAVRGGGNRSADKTRLLRDAELPADAIKEYKEAGLDVYVWVFSYPDASLRRDEIALYRDFIAEGADGIIINAEVSWKVPQANALAEQHVSDIRAALGDVWVAHAPFALPIFHQDFPYNGFAGLDAILTQLYWTEFGDAGLKPWIERYNKQWSEFKAKNPKIAQQPVHPIGVTYGKELGKKWGMKQVPPGEFHVADLDLFMDTFADDPMPSLYTLEAMHEDARDYLIARAGNQKPETEEPEMPEKTEDKALEAHLPAQGKTLRANSWGQAYRLTEEAPKYDGTVDSVLKIVSWLGVEKGGRWQPKPGTTYCNVYAHDLCNLIGAYVPRVWWNDVNKTDRAELGKTVHELSANALFRWFKENSEKFGWRRVYTLDELQEAANDGDACVIVACNRNEQWSGHIACVIGESDRCKAQRVDGKVALPVQSQAGAKNYELSNISSWWTSGTFIEHGFWVHGPKVDVTVGEVEQASAEDVKPQLVSTIVPPPMPPPQRDVSTELANVPETPSGFFGMLITFLLKLISLFTKR